MLADKLRAEYDKIKNDDYPTWLEKNKNAIRKLEAKFLNRVRQGYTTLNMTAHTPWNKWAFGHRNIHNMRKYIQENGLVMVENESVFLDHYEIRL